MKIVFSTDHVYLHGGIEKVLVEKANYFADILHYEVTILTTQQGNRPSCYPLSANVKLVDLGINYDRDKSFFHIFNLRKIFDHYNKRKKFFEETNPDFVIVVNYDFDYYWTPFMHKSSKKIKEYHSSQHMRSEGGTSLKRNLINKIIKLIENRYDALVVLNKEEQSFFKSSNTYVIPNPIPIPQYQAKLDKMQVLAAGRIAPVKGFERLLEAWTLIVKKHPCWELHFYGEDYLDTQSKLETQMTKLKIEKSVSFKNVTQDMTKTMLDYSLYLMTSHSESFSMVILEASSVGLPSVAFDVPTGPRSLIKNNVNGVLVTNNDIESYAEIVSSLMHESSRRKLMGIAAKESSLNFASANVLVKWSELFNKLSCSEQVS